MKYLIWSLIALSLALGAWLLIYGAGVSNSRNITGAGAMISGSILFVGGLIALVLQGKNQNRY